MQLQELLLRYIDVNSSMIYKDKVVIDVSSDDLYISHSSSFFVSLGWPPGEIGGTYLRFFLTGKGKTFARNLVTKMYDWYPILYKKSVNGTTKTMNAAYAVEMQERVYK